MIVTARRVGSFLLVNTNNQTIRNKFTSTVKLTVTYSLSLAFRQQSGSFKVAALRQRHQDGPLSRRIPLETVNVTSHVFVGRKTLKPACLTTP